MANYPQELAQVAVCQSHTGHMTGLWFLPTRPLRLNTNECMCARVYIYIYIYLWMYLIDLTWVTRVVRWGVDMIDVTQDNRSSVVGRGID